MTAFTFGRLLAVFLLLFSLNAIATAPPLPEKGTGSLQRGLERVLREQGLSQAVKDQRLAVALVRLEKGDATALAMVNGNQMMYAASLPKIAILYGAAVAIDEGRVKLTPALHQDINDMIRYSCNACSNRVLDRIGRFEVLDLLQSGPYPFYDRDHGGGLWIGKDYAKASAFRRDPLKGFSHGATAWQVARWYYRMYNGDLASEAGTALMKEALVSPAINHKLVRGLRSRVTDVIFRKSGTWKEYHADSVLVESNGDVYILVVLVRDSRGERWIQRLAPALHDLATGAG
jgi:beta-lactamase class A